jgi:Sugar-transfer associated ATP-grasp
MRALQRIRRKSRLAYLFLQKEFRSKSRLPLLRRLSYSFRGYLSWAERFYDLESHKLSDYVSNWSEMQMTHMYDHRNPAAGYQYGLNNKIFAAAILGQVVNVPKVYAVIEHGTVLPLKQPIPPVVQSTWLNTCQAANGRIVIKPVAGAGGNGVTVLSAQDGLLYLGDERITEGEAQALVNSLDEYILSEFVQQGEYAATLFPHTANTIRIVTIIDPDTGEPHMAFACQRVGSERSRPVDNFSKGGLFSEIDLESGRLGLFACMAGDQHVTWLERHPDTSARLEGIQVPQWDELKGTILAAASSLPYLKSLAWDIVVLDDGVSVLEADAYGVDQDLIPHHPLLKDERVRRFFEYHDLLRTRLSIWR